MSEMQRALARLLLHLPALLLVGVACSGEVAEHDTDPREVVRLDEQFAGVRAELLAADVSRLDAEQRRKRERHIARLAEYAAGGVFPHNHDRAERTPFFIDHHGTRCAMAHLIEQSGRGDLARIARDDNDAYIAELAGDPDLIAWLDENGLTAAEAACIQPTYDCDDGSPGPCNASGGSSVEFGYRPGVAFNVAVGVTSGALLALNLSSSEGSKARGFLGFFAGALGVTTGLLSMGEEEDRAVRTLGGANIGIGLVAVAVGLDVRFREPPAPPAADMQATRQAARQDHGVSVQPLLSDDSVGLAMGGSF